MEDAVLSRRTFCVVFLLGVYVHIKIGADSERTRSTPSGPTTPNEPHFLLTNCIRATESVFIFAPGPPQTPPGAPTPPNEPQFLLTNCIGATESGCILAAAAAAGCVSRQFLL